MKSSLARSFRSGSRCLPGVILLLLAGCGGSLHPVSGKVMVDDEPLTTGAVHFHPDASKGNSAEVHPFGQIDAEGNYTITTGGKPGAPAGWYKVTVVASEMAAPGKPGEAPKRLVGEKFLSPEKTPLSVEVVPEPAPGAYDLKVTAK